MVTKTKTVKITKSTKATKKSTKSKKRNLTKKSTKPITEVKELTPTEKMAIICNKLIMTEGIKVASLVINPNYRQLILESTTTSVMRDGVLTPIQLHIKLNDKGVEYYGKYPDYFESLFAKYKFPIVHIEDASHPDAFGYKLHTAMPKGFIDTAGSQYNPEYPYYVGSLSLKCLRDFIVKDSNLSDACSVWSLNQRDIGDLADIVYERSYKVDLSSNMSFIGCNGTYYLVSRKDVSGSYTKYSSPIKIGNWDDVIKDKKWILALVQLNLLPDGMRYSVTSNWEKFVLGDTKQNLKSTGPNWFKQLYYI